MSSPTPEALRKFCEGQREVALSNAGFCRLTGQRSEAPLWDDRAVYYAALLALLDAQDAPPASVSRAQVEALETEESIEWHCDVVRLRDVLALFASPPARDDAPAAGAQETCERCAERDDYTRAKDYRPSGLVGMHWSKQPDWELCQRGGKGRCSVWLNGTWHTWDTRGIGGENGREATVEDAFREAEAAMVRQGWAKPATPGAGGSR